METCTAGSRNHYQTVGIFVCLCFGQMNQLTNQLFDNTEKCVNTYILLNDQLLIKSHHVDRYTQSYDGEEM